MRTMTKIWIIAAALSLCFGNGGPVAPAAADREAAVVVHGEPLGKEGQAIEVEHRLLVPLRCIAEAADWTVTWDEPEQTAAIAKNGKAVRISLNSGTAWAGGTAYSPTPPPCLKDGRIFVPLRAIGEMLGENIYWDEPTRTAIVGELLSESGPQDEILFAVIRQLYAVLPDVFRLETTKAIRENLALFYAGDLLETTTAAIRDYVNGGPTDYGVFAFLGGTVVQKNPVTATVQIRYAYLTLGSPPEEGRLLAGLRQTECGWRIVWENYQ